MIDTAVLRIHNIRRHQKILNYIRGFSGGSSKLLISAPADVIDEISQRAFFTRELERIEAIKDNNTGEVFLKYGNRKVLNSSGHYYLNFSINRQRDYIEINFSIPKYKYGTNIFLFTEHQNNRDFQFSYNSQIKYNLLRSYNRLLVFLDNFFKREFKEWYDRLDYSLIEINRIDLCYNQVFLTKSDALNYLKYQKKIKKKNIRKESDFKSTYDTSVFFNTKQYSFKIYHKGTEFLKHDKKELKKINLKKGKEYFDIDQIQSIADRMLRYEMTFRNSYLSYLFKRKLFRKDCPIFQGDYKIYLEVENLLARDERISKKAGEIKNKTRKADFLRANPYSKIESIDRRTHSEMKKLINRNSTFFLKVDKYSQEYNSTTNYEYIDHRAKFSKELFKIISIRFLKAIKEFQIQEMPNEFYIEKCIEAYNACNPKEKRLPKKEMIMFYALLNTNNWNWDYILKSGNFSRSSIFVYKKRFKTIGVTERNVTDHISYPFCEDMSEYHNLFMFGDLHFPGKKIGF